MLLLQGLRKHIGFEYDVDEDTVEDVTCEMLQNLSLREDQVRTGEEISVIGFTELVFCGGGWSDGFTLYPTIDGGEGKRARL